MEKRKNRNEEEAVPLSSLRVVAPPLRLVSAAMWKVMQRRDVVHYGKLEEFVTAICEGVPGLLNYRHQAKLTLGLRARLILELCKGTNPPEPHIVLPELDRFQTPSSTKKKRDVKVERTMVNFRALVEMLLEDPAERELFFQEVFPIDYGADFDAAIEKLLWEFLTRLDSLLPTPNLAQTVSWLSAAPKVLEEFAPATCQPHLLAALLHHQKCLGHMEEASLPDSTGNSILSSLSLPPSGRVQRKGQSESTSLTPPTNSGSGLPGEDSAIATSAKKETRGGAGSSSSRDVEKAEPNVLTESSDYTWVKDKRDKAVDEEMDEERGKGSQLEDEEMDQEGGKGSQSGDEEMDEETSPLRRSGRVRRHRQRGELRKRARWRGRSDRETGGDGEVEGPSPAFTSCLDAGTEHARLKLPKEKGLGPLLASCLRSQPQVLLTRLGPAEIASFSAGKQQGTPGKQEMSTAARSRKLSVGAATSEEDLSAKENKASPFKSRRLSPVVKLSQATADKHPKGAPVKKKPVCTSSPSEKAVPESGDDIIADSEDESVKNFKGRLFVKRYYKTKHDTFVPTLREFWRPGLARRDLLSPGNGHR